jgi:PilZ domain
MPGRKEERFDTALTVRLEGGGEGVARNVSASGIFFVTNVALEAGQPVRFSLKFLDFPGGPIEVNCSARVMRVEEQGAGRGVGASIDSFDFHTLSDKRSA